MWLRVKWKIIGFNSIQTYKGVNKINEFEVMQIVHSSSLAILPARPKIKEQSAVNNSALLQDLTPRRLFKRMHNLHLYLEKSIDLSKKNLSISNSFFIVFTKAFSATKTLVKRTGK